MVVCLKSKVSFAKRYHIKDHRHFCYILEAHFLENQSRLFGQISPIFENMYLENKKLSELTIVFLLCVNNHCIILPNTNTFYAIVLQKIKT